MEVVLMNELLQIIQSIKNENSRLGKEKLIQQNRNNSLFIEVLKFVYNPFITTGISDKKIKKKLSIKINEDHDFDNLPNLLHYLQENNTGRDYDIAVVQNFINKFDSNELKELITDIAIKDLKIGISTKTVNKVLGKNFVPSFGVMLAESYDDYADKIDGVFYITQKLDGNRCVIVKDGDSIKFFSRSGQEIEGLDEIKKEVEFLPNNIVLDGELLAINNTGASAGELFRQTQKQARKKGVKTNLEFWAFDILSVDEFKNGKSVNAYKDRRERLESIIDYATNNFDLKYIKYIPVIYKGTDKGMIHVLAKFADEKGWEGLMLNVADAPYEAKRTANLLKIKKMKTADLYCIAIETGDIGDFKNIMTRINVVYKDNVVGVGSGFTIEDRKKFAKDPDAIVGKIVEVQYFEETTDEKGNPSLRFPVFKRIRHDKTIDDINYK